MGGNTGMMMSYVLETDNNKKIIVIDGGYNDDAQNFRDFMKSIGKDTIDAWFITHPDFDHMNVCTEVLKDPQKLFIRNLYFSFPAVSELTPECEKYYIKDCVECWLMMYGSDFLDISYRPFKVALDNSPLLKKGMRVIKPERNSTIIIDNTRFDILGVANPEIKVDPRNNSSMIIKAISQQKTVLFLADIGILGAKKLLDSGADIKAEYVQMAHHGYWTFTKEDVPLYDYIAPSFCLWPTPWYVWDDLNAGGSITPCSYYKKWMQNLGVVKNYVAALDGLVKISSFFVNVGKDKTMICGDEIQLDNTKDNYSKPGGKLKYQWFPTTGLDDPTSPAPFCQAIKTTSYALTATTNEGWTSTDTIKVTVLPMFVNAGKDKTIVCSGPVQLDSVKSNYSGKSRLKYKWSPSEGLNSDTIVNPLCLPKKTTTYEVTVIPTIGPSVKDTVTVFVEPFVAKACDDLSLQYGDSVKLSTKTNFTGTQKLRYKWTPSDFLSNDTLAEPVCSATRDITYNVEVSSPYGCSYSDDVKVKVVSIVVDAGPDKTIVCSGPVILDSVKTNYRGKGRLRYRWTPSAGLNSDTVPNPIIGPSVTTTYKISVTPPVGPPAYDSITIKVNDLVAEAGEDFNVYYGDSLMLGVGCNYTGTKKLTYFWSPPDGLSDCASANPICKPTKDITYSVKVLTAEGCSASDTVSVRIIKLKADAGSDKTIDCSGSVRLDSVKTNYRYPGKLKYIWTPSIGLSNDTIPNPVCYATKSTNYRVTVVPPQGSIMEDSVYVNVNPLKIEACGNKAVLIGSEVQLGVSSNFKYGDKLKFKWYPSDGLNNDTIKNPVLTASVSRKYTVTASVRGAAGCTDEDSVIVKVLPITLTTGSDKVVVCGGSVKLDSVKTNFNGKGRIKYRWFPSTGLSSDTIVNPVCSVRKTTTYVLEVIPPYGQSLHDTVNVKVLPFVAKACDDFSIECGDYAQLNVEDNYSGNKQLMFKWVPSTGLNNDTIRNPKASPVVDTRYLVTVYTNDSISSTDSVNVIKTKLKNLGIVRVSVQKTKNIIYWKHAESRSIESFGIYKENQTNGKYEKIASVKDTEKDYYVDSVSNPQESSCRYRITVLDKCGVETLMSNYHKTIHLTAAGSGSNVNLTWDEYVGFEVKRYDIYRGITADTLTLIDSLETGKDYYNDDFKLNGTAYYTVEAIGYDSDGTDDMVVAQPYKNKTERRSKSNIVSVHVTDNNNPVTNPVLFKFNPNPASNQIEITSIKDNGEMSDFKIFNLMGVVVKSVQLESEKEIVKINDLEDGVYMISLKCGPVIQMEKLIIRR
jgi:beta-lactamase superfamily II metal-dependent hydrolase